MPRQISEGEEMEDPVGLSLQGVDSKPPAMTYLTRDPDSKLPPEFHHQMEASTLRLLFSAMASVEEGQIRVRRGDDFRTSIALFGLASHYFEEMSTCSDAGAKLAANVMACSGLEALLMIAAICYRQQVASSRSWAKNKKAKKQKTFLEKLSVTEISCLLEVATELKWFDAVIPDYIEAAVDPADYAVVRALHAKDANLSEVAGQKAKDLRNLLHPGKCLRDDVQLQDSQALTDGMALMGLALCSFFAQHSKGITPDQLEAFKRLAETIGQMMRNASQ